MIVGEASPASPAGLADKKGVRTLLDKNAYHQFQPLLYQVATAELTPDDIAFDLEDIFRGQENIEVRKARWCRPTRRRESHLADDTTIDGDVVVRPQAPSRTSSTRRARRSSPSCSTRSMTPSGSARASSSSSRTQARSPSWWRRALTFVVVGGGATGVEAGALAELLHNVMPHVYEHLAIAGARVILVDLGTRCSLLSPTKLMPTPRNSSSGEGSSSGSALREGDRGRRTLSDGTTLKTHLTVWGGPRPLRSRSVGTEPGSVGASTSNPT